MRRALTSTVLAGALAIALTACGGGTSTTAGTAGAASSASATPTVAAELTGASFLAQTNTALTKAGSYAFTYSATVSGSTVSGTGRVVSSGPSDMALETSTEVSGVSVKMLMVAGHVYMDGAIAGQTGKWIDLADSSNSSLSGMADSLAKSADPSALLSSLSGDAVKINRGEKSTIDGTEVTAYHVAMDVAEIAKATGQTLTQAQLDQFKTAAGASSMGVIYYVDKDNRPVKVTLKMGSAMTQEMTYTGYGTQDPIVAPAADTVVLASTLGM